MTNHGSVTQLVEKLRSADRGVRDDAAEQLWRLYFPKVLALACNHLDARVRRREDEEDVAVCAFNSFCGHASAAATSSSMAGTTCGGCW